MRKSHSLRSCDWRLRRCVYWILLCATSGTSRAQRSDEGQRDAIKRIQTKNLKILLIDDETEYRSSMRALLERVFRARVEDVDSGKAGVAKIKGGNRYDVIFLDLMMPEMNGNETRAELLREDSSLFIAFMSAFSDSQEWQIAKNSGAPLLVKPLELEHLIEVLTVP